MNSDKALKLLAQGIEPALVNEMLRRELGKDTVRPMPIAPAYSTRQATLVLPLEQWSAQVEIEPFMPALRSTLAAYRDKRSKSPHSTGALLREVYAVAKDIPSVKRMRDVAARALLLQRTRGALAELVVRESGGTCDTRVSSIDAWLTGYRAPTMREAHAMAQGISALGMSPRELETICARAEQVIDLYRSTIGLSPSRTVPKRNVKGDEK